MPYICCLPGCSNRHPEHNLFSVPSKRFCGEGTAKYAWAEKLERVVKHYRGDAQIDVLFKKDRVKICEVHFEENDILTSEFVSY